jgi:hypothetical protein
MLLFAIVAYTFYYYPLSNRRYVFCDLNTSGGHYIVSGVSNGPLDGWGMRLFWKRAKSAYWVSYYLDHDEPYWSDVKLTQSGSHIFVTKSEQAISDLDTQSGLNYINRFKENRLPICAYTGDPFLPGGEGKQIDSDSPEWSSVWSQVRK